MLYDTFLFFNELDLLEIRLNVLAPLVDRFVLVEATQDHSGRDKPLYYGDNRERFAAFSDRIEHVVVDEFPRGKDRWVRENHQRRAIMQGLRTCTGNDLVLISDVDEIPNPRAVARHLHCSADALLFFEQRYHCYFLNCQRDGSKWLGTAMTRYRNLDDLQRIRDLRTKPITWWRGLVGPKVKHVPDGGWHFTFMGGIDAIVKKIEAFAHSEFDLEEFKSPERIREKMNDCLDLFVEEDGPSYRVVAMDDSYPNYLREHADRYSHMLHQQGA